MGAKNLARVLEAREVAALAIFQAWQRITQDKPPDIYPRVELFNGWDFFGSPKICTDVFGTRGAPLSREWLEYITLARECGHWIRAEDDGTGPGIHDPGWVPLFLALSQINHVTVQGFIRRCLTPYELAYGVPLYSSFLLIRRSPHEYTRFLHI